ncbi:MULTISPECIES: hypothetical protein [Actinomadura]|uniref:hypothetical protein n=1 Tax=Actinomadura TaxID=1988 RepID=UPI001485DFED|nr:hypothetical protein [Actinomadura geliboluensis]
MRELVPLRQRHLPGGEPAVLGICHDPVGAQPLIGLGDRRPRNCEVAVPAGVDGEDRAPSGPEAAKKVRTTASSSSCHPGPTT